MALQLYDAKKATAPATESSKDELTKLSNKIAALKSGARSKTYLGLSNQGATCYMNSAI